MKESLLGIGADSEESAPGIDWLIVGVGTPASRDDEIGLALVRALSREPDYSKCCTLLEFADAALVASSLLEWQKPVLLADAADMGIEPGAYRFFSDRDASINLKSSSVSSHGLGLGEGLELARTLGYDQPVYIFGIQPFDLSPKQGLTPEMNALFPALLKALKDAFSSLRR
jgi:hydrogenase maturation protease